MRFGKLKIHNIASIADAEIDFSRSPILDEAVFLICGETGSGKTTILDSICLALYNRTPRLSQASQRDSYIDSNGEVITLVNPSQYMKKGTWDASVELSFEAQGKEWTASWSVHRANRKADGKIQGVRWELYDHQSGITYKGSESEAITGLGFDEFKRTTMLAQGEFTAFLKSNDNEKSAILEKVTGTEVYKRIGKRISERYKESSARYDIISEKVKVMKESVLDENASRNLKDEVCTLTGKLEELRTEQSSLDAAIEAFRKQQELEGVIRKHEGVISSARNEFSRLKGGILYAEGFLLGKQEEMKEITSFIESESPYAEMYSNVSSAVSHLEKIEFCESAIMRLRNINAALEESLAVYMQEKEKAAGKVRSDEDKHKEQESRIASLKDERCKINHEGLKTRRKNLEVIRQLSEQEERLAATLKSTQESLAIEQSKQDGLKADMEEATSRYNQTLKLYDKLKESNEQWAKDARASLVPGESCPVCGQVIPSAEYLKSISDAHFQSLLAPVESEMIKLKEYSEHVTRLYLENNAGIKAMTALLSDQTKEKDAVSGMLVKAVAENGGAYDAGAYEQICAEIERYDAIGLKIEQEAEAFNKMSGSLMKSKEELAGIEMKIGKTASSIRSNKEKVEENIAEMEKSSGILDGIIAFADWRKTWEEDKEGFKKNLASRAAAYVNAVNQAKTLAEQISFISDTMVSIRTCSEEIISIIPSFKDIPSGSRSKVERLEGVLNQMKAELMVAVSGIKDAETELKSVKDITSRLDMTTVNKRKEEINTETEKISKIIGAHVKTLEDNDKNLKKMEEEETRLASESNERNQWKALNDVFGKKDGEYFQKIAQGFIMNDILGRANHYLKKMSKRYLLESQNGSLNIIIRDLEQGGVPRSTSTISGGESFIISLALALGLSSLDSERVSADILFIDEGFGSLSDDHLNTVMDTLQRLHESSGKRIGIISHIDQLRTRIGVKIQLKKISQTTSTINIQNGGGL